MVPLKRIVCASLVAAALFTAAPRTAATQLPSDPPTVGGETECTTTIYWYWHPTAGPIFLWAEESCVTVLDE